MRVNTRYIKSTIGTSSGGIIVRCIYTHARQELPNATQVFVVVLVLRISIANELPCVLILHGLSGPRCFRFLNPFSVEFHEATLAKSNAVNRHVDAKDPRSCVSSLQRFSARQLVDLNPFSVRPRFLAQMLLTDTLTQRIHVLVFIIAEVLGPPAGGPGDEQPHGHGDRAAVLPAVSRPPAADAGDLGGGFRSARRGGGRHGDG